MISYPLQAFGLGDVIFTQTLIRAFGDPIVWGVEPHFIEGLQRAYPDITWVAVDRELVELKQDTVIDGKHIIPIRWADSLLRVPYTQCMRTKYDLYQLDYNIWKRDAMFHYDNRILNHVRPKGEYNIINEHFQSDFKGNSRINVNNGAENIYITPTPGYSLFDWAYLLHGAKEIHAISSAILYILELLDLKQPIHLYPRPTDPKFKHVDYLFTKPYILH